MSTNHFAAAECLRGENNREYRALPIPNRRDAEIEALLRTWIALDESSRQAAAQGIGAEQQSTLLAYSERMASLAVRKRDQELIFLGLLALGIDGWRIDSRDNLLIVSLHYDAAQRIAADKRSLLEKAGALLWPNAGSAFTSLLFERAAAVLQPQAASGLRSFLRRRSPVDKTIEAMGYVAGTDVDGFRYKRTW